MEYSLARLIVQRFERSHPKGVQIFKWLYHPKAEFGERCLITGSGRWRGYKALVKHLEEMLESYRKGYLYSRDWGSNYYTFVKYMRRVLKRRSFPAALDLLDKEIVQLEDERARDQRTMGPPSSEVGPQQLDLFSGV